MKDKSKSISIIIIISNLCADLILLFSLTACSLQTNEYTLEDKVTEEIRYLENQLILVVNNFALGKYLEDNEILEDTRNVQEASSRIIVDLAAENIEKDEISKLSEGINNMIDLASLETEGEYLVELNNIFSLFPNFEAKISTDSDVIFNRREKYYTVSSYIAYTVGDKEIAKTQIENLESEYLEKQKSIDYVENHKYNMNKIYLLIEEFKNAIEMDSRVLVKEKYLLLINEL